MHPATISMEINFRLIIDRDSARIIEQNSPADIQFKASAILKSEYLPAMLADAFVSRLKEIISEYQGRDIA